MNFAERAGLRARPRRRFGQLVELLRPAPDATPLIGQAPPMTLGQVVRRTVGRWVSDSYQRRPMIIPVVIEA